MSVVGRRVAKKTSNKNVEGSVKKVSKKVATKTSCASKKTSKKTSKKASKKSDLRETESPSAPFHASNFDDGPERFAYLVGVMLDEKLSAHGEKVEEIISSLKRQNSFISSLRDEVRPRLANHERELDEIRSDIKVMRVEIDKILNKIGLNK